MIFHWHPVNVSYMFLLRIKIYVLVRFVSKQIHYLQLILLYIQLIFSIMFLTHVQFDKVTLCVTCLWVEYIIIMNKKLFISTQFVWSNSYLLYIQLYFNSFSWFFTVDYLNTVIWAVFLSSLICYFKLNSYNKIITN